MPSKTANTAPVSDEYKEVAGDDDEFVEHKGQDFAPTHDFDENDTLIGVYNGSRIVDTKNGERPIHTFETSDGEVDAWGTAILNSRLEGLEGTKVKVFKTGKKLSTKGGRKAWEFRVYVAKGSLARRSA